ncbi:MAG: dUTP diphosphatase [Verrucomicrobia bacterium]|nr:dUTP diphosphatase [Verrucomicrobiota bacterium]
MTNDQPLKLRMKKLVPEAVVPAYAKPGDAGLDLTATSVKFDEATRKLKVGFGLAMEIPFGYVGLLFPRSSVHKTGLVMSNCVGVIDSGYRGEVCSVFYVPEGAQPYAVGDRCAQLIVLPYPQVQTEEASELSETARGTGGFGSTGA